MPQPRHQAAAIALGSNLGDRAANLHAAMTALRGLPGTRSHRFSPFFQTAPVGPIPQGPYLNAAATIETSLEPRPLLTALHQIEQRLGRDRSAGERWGPRTIDLDLLLFGDTILDQPGLTLPHPRMLDRPFVLIPLAAIGPDRRIPQPSGHSLTVREALESLRRAGGVNPADCTLYPCP